MGDNRAYESARSALKEIKSDLFRYKHCQECSGDSCPLTQDDYAELEVVHQGYEMDEDDVEEFHNEEKALESLTDVLSVATGLFSRDEDEDEDEDEDDFYEPEENEYEIMLGWGGPAVRLIGELNRYNEPDSADLQYQDWGTPWTSYPLSDDDEELLVEFARMFYFE